MKVGVLALQGAVIEHMDMLQKCNVKPIEVRRQKDFKQLTGLIIPGGESTTIGRLINRFNLRESIHKLKATNVPIMGTCAGLILLAKDIEDQTENYLDLLDVSVKRNGFGRQRESFETSLEVSGIIGTVNGVFIRAPYVTSIGPGVKVLAYYQNKIVAVREGNILGCSFHPELTDDLKIHEYFVNMIKT